MQLQILEVNSVGCPVLTVIYIFRADRGWNTQGFLLLDGGIENPEINMQNVIFWPDNIVQHFKTFGVKSRFDLLSVYTDSYEKHISGAVH